MGIDPYRTLLAEAAVPEGVASLVSYLFTELFDGRNAVPTDGITRALGRAPRDFGDYARVAAASGVWSAT